MRPALATLLAVLLAAGCGGDDDDVQADAAPVATVTWHQDIAPLVAEHCASCHVPGGIGPMDLTEYDTAALFAPMMVAKVEAGEMPPWDAKSTDDCETRLSWREDPTLSADQIELPGPGMKRARLSATRRPRRRCPTRRISSSAMRPTR